MKQGRPATFCRGRADTSQMNRQTELRYGEGTLDTAHGNAGMTSIIWTMLLFAGHSCFIAHTVSVLQQSDSLQNQKIDDLWQCSSSGIGSCW